MLASGGKEWSSANPHFRVFSRVQLARLLFTISPKWRACSQAVKNVVVEPKSLKVDKYEII